MHPVTPHYDRGIHSIKKMIIIIAYRIAFNGKPTLLRVLNIQGQPCAIRLNTSHLVTPCDSQWFFQTPLLQFHFLKFGIK